MTTGQQNVAVGYHALGAATTSQETVAIGYQAGDAYTGAHHNVMIGWQAAGVATSGGNNIFIGSMAGNHDTATVDGYELTIVGARANGSASDSTEEVCLGYNITGAGNNTFRVGASSGAFHTGNTTTWSTTSDQRIKKNIVDNEQGLDVINAIRVRNFNYKTPDEIAEASPELAELKLKQIAVDKTELQIGAIAQEIETVLPECVMDDDYGIKQVNADRLIWHTIKAIQELSKKVSALESV